MENNNLFIKSNDEIINYQEGLKRFANKPELYNKYLNRFLTDETFFELTEAMRNKDYEAAFKCSHTFKGSTGNLSLTLLYNNVVLFVEKLRNNTDIEGAVEEFKHITALYDRTVDEIRKMNIRL